MIFLWENQFQLHSTQNQPLISTNHSSILWSRWGAPPCHKFQPVEVTGLADHTAAGQEASRQSSRSYMQSFWTSQNIRTKIYYRFALHYIRVNWIYFGWRSTEFKWTITSRCRRKQWSGGHWSVACTGPRRGQPVDKALAHVPIHTDWVIIRGNDRVQSGRQWMCGKPSGHYNYWG